MKFTAAAALLFAVPSVNAFAPTTVAFRTSTQVYSTEAATEEKVGHDINDLNITEYIGVFYCRVYYKLHKGCCRCAEYNVKIHTNSHGRFE